MTSPLLLGASASSSLPLQPSSGPLADAAPQVFSIAPQFVSHTEVWLFSVSLRSAVPWQLRNGSISVIPRAPDAD